MENGALRHKARRRLARHVRLLRLLRGWSQEALAQRCGLHRTYIGAVERAERNVSLDNIELIANALGMSVGDLLTEDAFPRTPPPGPRWRLEEPRILYCPG